MKKVFLSLLVGVVGVCFAVSVSATEVKVQEKTVETAKGAVTTDKMEVKNAAGEEKVKVTETGNTVNTTIEKNTPKNSAVKKEIVQFQSYDKGANTITVIKDKKEVVVPVGKDLKDPTLIQKNQMVVITSTYDTKLLKDVVIDMVPHVPAQ